MAVDIYLPTAGSAGGGSAGRWFTHNLWRLRTLSKALHRKLTVGFVCCC
jgi:hypothetical protein